MTTYLGIGFGPIQTGIFLDGAHRGGVDRMVVADVDADLIRAVRADRGVLRINVASPDGVSCRTIPNVEAYNPADPDDRPALIAAAEDAVEISTALPNIGVYAGIAGWLREGFGRAPDRRRFVYAAENHNHAAEALEAAVGSFPATHYLNTVIGKMSCVLSAEDCGARQLATLTDSADRGHLVEAFDRILIESCPDIVERRILGLIDKPHLLPFEEAKLYGHNAIHLWLGLHARRLGMEEMSELTSAPGTIDRARVAFVEEIGPALCGKWDGTDDLFTPHGFAAYADDLLARMANAHLTDRVDRVCRNLELKMSWDDRLIGSIRQVLSRTIPPVILAEGAARAAHDLYGRDPEVIRTRLSALWGDRGREADAVWSWIERSLASDPAGVA